MTGFTWVSRSWNKGDRAVQSNKCMHQEESRYDRRGLVTINYNYTSSIAGGLRE